MAQSYCRSITTLTASGAIDLGYDVYVLDATAGNITVTLPSMTKLDGVTNLFKRSDNTTNAVVLLPQAGQTIDGASSRAIASNSGFGSLTYGGNMITTLGPAAQTVFANGAASDTMTSSSSPQLMNSMTVTPIMTGVYVIIASTSGNVDSSGANLTIALYNNNALIPTSVRSVTQASAGSDSILFTQAVATVVGGTTVELRWSTTDGTATAHQRTISINRVA